MGRRTADTQCRTPARPDGKANDDIEAMSVYQAIRAIERCEVAVLLCDANDGVSEQDAKILGLAEERGRAMVVALNKSDLLNGYPVEVAIPTLDDPSDVVPVIQMGLAHR